MSVTLLDSWTDVTSTLVLPTVSVGENRKVVIVIGKANGSGTASMVNSVSVGGVTATYEGGFPFDTPYNRCTVGVFTLNELQLSELNGSSIVFSGGSGAGTQIAVATIQGSHQSTSTSSFLHIDDSAAKLGEISLLRDNDSYTVYAVSRNVGFALELSNPATQVDLPLGGYRLAVGSGEDGSLNSPIASYTSAGAGRSGQVIVNFPPATPSGAYISENESDLILFSEETNSLSFKNLISDPISLSILRNGVIVDQPNFVLSPVNEGSATATFTTTIGNLPYTDINHSPIDYSYVVTCEDSSELTLSGISISPSTSRNLATANNPVNDSTSIILQWIEGLAQTGDQIDYPKQVENVTLTVNPDFTHAGVVPEGEEFPSSISFDVNYWDSVSGERYPVTIELSFKEHNSEILEFVPPSTDALETTFLGVRNFSVNESVPATTDGLIVSFTGAEESFISEIVPSSSDVISIEFFASSEGFINELVPSSTDIIVSTFEKINFSNIVEFIPSSTDSINVTFDQPVRINEQVPATKDSIIIFYGEKLFTPSLSRTLHIKP